MAENQSKPRFANGVAAAVITCLFSAHALMGGIACLMGLVNAEKWIVWLGVAVIVLHVVLSIVTSAQQLGDAERPPSTRKKRHLALKWVTGGLLAAIAIVHIAGNLQGLSSLIAGILSMALCAGIAVHVCVGAKSLVADLGAGKALIAPVRFIACAIAVAAGVLMLASIVS